MCSAFMGVNVVLMLWSVLIVFWCMKAIYSVKPLTISVKLQNWEEAFASNAPFWICPCVYAIIHTSTSI